MVYTNTIMGVLYFKWFIIVYAHLRVRKGLLIVSKGE